MANGQGEPAKPPASFGEALGEQGETRQEKLLKATEELRLHMEKVSAEVRDLILAQPPLELLGYLSAQFHMGVLADLREKGDEYRPNKDLIKKFQFAME